MTRQRRWRTAVFLFFLCLAAAAAEVSAAAETIAQEEEISSEGAVTSPEETGGIVQDSKKQTGEALLEDLELSQMQEAVNELLGKETFSIEEALKRVLQGETLFSKEFFLNLVKNFLAEHFLADRETLAQVLLLVLMAALFSNFTHVFGSSQTGEASFYVVYMLLLAILIHFFSTVSQELSESLGGFITFMKALMPSYFLAVTAASGAATAMVFYEMVLAVIYVIQVLLLKAVIPGICAYVILKLVNYLHKEDFLSKLADLLKLILEWTMKTCTAVILGMQIIQNMISPAMDSLKRDMLGKTAAAIPGIGNAVNGVTEIALGTAVLIRNCLGAAGILVLLILGLPPVIKLGSTVLLYKFLAAIVQPVSDARMVGCLNTVGEGCRLLLKVLLTVELLLLITIAILSVSFLSG